MEEVFLLKHFSFLDKALLNLSVDWQRSFQFADNRGFGGWGGLGISILFKTLANNESMD